MAATAVRPSSTSWRTRPRTLSWCRDVEVGGWFVEEQDARLLGEGAGDDDSLAFASGEGVEGAVRELLGLRLAHGIAGDSLVTLALDLEASEVRVPAHEDELHRRESVGVGDDLRHDGEPRGDFLRCQGPQVCAVEVNVPALHAKHAGNCPQEGGLARAVGANQPHHLPMGRVQVCAVKQRFGLNLKEDALRANRPVACRFPSLLTPQG